MAKAKAKTKAPKEEKLEDILFKCRDHLRGRAPMTDKRDLLLTLVFLKFISERFNERKEQILEENKEDPDFAQIAVTQPSFYNQNGVFYLTEDCDWQKLCITPSAVDLDNAIHQLEAKEPKLKNALPQQIFTKTALEPSVLKSVCDEVNKIDQKKFKEKDLIGRVYEYFLQAFSINADKEEGEFYTPHSIVELIASLIEPFDGTIYDPCCGSGGMFIQSAKFIEAHGGNTLNINVYGQESEPSTFRLAKMNLAVRGISSNLGEKPASTFTDDQHPDKNFNYIMANPPFNLKSWRGSNELTDDVRWKGFQTPPESNANYAWILHMLNKLNAANGVAGFLLANGALDDSDTKAIRQKLIGKDKIEAIIVLPREMFYSTDISVTLWILNNNKKGGLYHKRHLRNRENEILFVDLRTWNKNIYEKKFVQFTEEQIQDICKIYFDWQTLQTTELNNFGSTKYEKAETYYSAGLEEIKQKNYSLVPSRYIEFVDRDTEIDYKTALATSGKIVSELLQQQEQNRQDLINAFKVIGYEAE